MKSQRKRILSGVLATIMFLSAIFAYHPEVYAADPGNAIIAEGEHQKKESLGNGETPGSEEGGPTKGETSGSEEDGPTKGETSGSEEDGPTKGETPGSEEDGPTNGETPGSEEDGPTNGETPGSEEGGPTNGETPGLEEGGPIKGETPGSEEDGPANGETPNTPEGESEKKKADTPAVWMQKPSWAGSFGQQKPPQVAEGEYAFEIYGEPAGAVTQSELSAIQAASLTETMADGVQAQNPIPEDNIIQVIHIYLNGKAYSGGELKVMEGDNFSYTYTWNPKFKQGDQPYKEGDWFEYTLFKVPNLNLVNHVKQPLMINGIKAGEWELNYNKTNGEMKYKVIFNRYIQFFDQETVLAQLSGSGKFSGTADGAPIQVGDKEGTLTIEKRPEIPQEPSVPSGTGWKPAEPPKFTNKLYAFGKGVKWDSSGSMYAPHEIDWRIVFFDQLQKQQQDFLNGKTPGETSGYCIIEDTLDVNQRFYDTKDIEFGETPFHIELPVIAPGTDRILNGSVGPYGSDSNYDGAGKITPYIRGEDLTEIDGSKATTKEAVSKIQQQVRNTPCSWTVTTNPETRQQTLLINLGKLGTTDPTKGITWDMAKGNMKWPLEELDKLIADCENKITAIEAGSDSPISLLDTRHQAVVNLLNRAVMLEANADNEELLKMALEAWRESYRTWRDHPEVDALAPLEQEVEGQLTVIVPLPEVELLNIFLDIPVNTGGTLFRNTAEYKNFEKSFGNLLADQKTYLANRTSYTKKWETVKERYINTKAFYSEKRIYGFAIKCRTESINTSMSSYKNTVKIEFEDKKFTAEDNAEVKFASGVMGNFALGSLVVQKADALYDVSGQQTTENIQKVEKDKAGIAGAKFKVYCGDGDKFVEDNDHLAHFMDKDASENGDTYFYTHSGDEHSGGPFEGEINEIATDDEGKIVLGRLTPLHTHFLVETEAPKGYYADDTPIPANSDQDSVSYELVGNVSRSVKIHKVDAYSRLPVSGAEFALYKGGQQVTGFVKKSINGHETFVADDSGKEKLLTNKNGELCIHGLDAGNYTLKEVEAAPGYILPNPAPEYGFELAEKLPENKTGMDEQYHLLLNQGNAVENEPDTAKLEITKQDGRTEAELKNAAYALFRFTGTEEEWAADPDREDKWKAVPFNEDSKYFKTTQTTGEMNLPNIPGNFGELPVAYTNKDGKISITDIPVGHYSLAEIQAPETYIRDYHSYYFDVNGDTVKTSVTLKNGLGDAATEVKDNVLDNFQRGVHLKLVKGDADAMPAVTGTEVNGGWKYEGSSVEGDGLSGAVYKLFMRTGASNRTNPNPEELKTTEIVGDESGRHDRCLAVGTTDENGVLELKDMTDKNGAEAYADGLNMEQYYMIEVKSPEGYKLNQTPIMFSLDRNVFPTDENGEITQSGTPGLVMAAENQKYDYGIKLIKTDAENDKPLQNVRFSISESGKPVTVAKDDITGNYRVDPSSQNTMLSTDASGEIFVTGLKPGTTYEVTEERAPQGYKKPEKSFEIKTPVSPEDGEAENNYLYTEREIKNERLKGKVMLHKEDEETGQALSGAEFELYYTKVEKIPPDDPDYDPDFPEATRSEDILLDTQTTDANGDLEFTDLEWREHYFLREKTAPEGYLLDETKLNFSIDETSFDRNGNPITVAFPYVKNSKGTVKEVILHKVDADNPDIQLEDAHFYLFKKITIENTESWVPYGKGIYITDADGEIRFRLPPGEYKLLELKAPDGYLRVEGDEVYFTVEDTAEHTGPIDITVENHKGSAGIVISKVLTLKDIDQKVVPVKDVAFKIYQGMIITEGKELYFVKDAAGVYRYTEDKLTLGAVNEVVTDENGQVRMSFPESFIPDPEDVGDILAKQLWYKEVRAPENVVIPEFDNEKNKLPIFVEDVGDYLHDWKEKVISNELSAEALSECKVTVHKQDGATRLGLPGAKFQLYKATDLGNGQFLEEPVGEPKVTDEQGNLVFDNLDYGYRYHIKEVEAPKGYVLDERVHSVVTDRTAFDEDFNFIPVKIHAVNDKIKGSVTLTKKDEDTGKLLEGAEFELFVKEENDTEPQWLHYGENRYVTDENGEINLELPHGEYKLIERAAPMGYVLHEPKEIHFKVETDGQHIPLEAVNKAFAGDKGTAKVVKTAKHSDAEKLAGAKFNLYYRGVDGEYYLRHTKEYVTDSNGTFTVENMPVGFSYAFKEIAAPDGYLISDEFFAFFIPEAGKTVTVEIENEKDDGDLTVKKTVGENGEKDRDFTFTVTLDDKTISGPYGNMTFQDGVATVELADGEWAKATGLPTGVKYTVREEKAQGYISEAVNDKGEIVGGENVTAAFINNVEKTSVDVTKVWDDKKNQDGIRPATVTIRLYADKKPTDKTLILSGDNQWQESFEDLYKYKDGKEIDYTVKEDAVEGYTSRIKGDKSQGYTITNSHMPETIEFDVTKKWEDSKNQDGKRPKSVKVRLYGNGIEVAAKEIKEADEWKCSFTKLPKYKDGKEIIYKVTEDTVVGYTSSVDRDSAKGFVVTNSYTPGKISVPVTKAWEDGNNQDGIRPKEITIKLYANEKVTDQTLILNEENHWTGSFSDLDEYKAGKKIVYTIEEVAVEGYESKVRGDAKKGFTVTNSHTPETIEIDVTKKWNDSNNQDGKRPGKVTVHLQADGKEVAAKEIKKTDDWKCSFTELPKYKAGKEIRYTVTEDAVADYTSSVDGDSAKGFVVTNSHTPETIEIDVTKKWNDSNNQDGKRPKTVTVRLYGDGKEVAAKEIKKTDDWKCSFTELPKYKDGKEIIYKVTEDAVADYTSSVGGDSAKGFVVTNSHTPETIEIDVTKKWNDSNNQDGKRPGKVTVRLQADGKEVAAKEIKKTDDWKCSFTGLSKYKDGKEIIYTVTEDAVAGYASSVDGNPAKGFVVTNSYTPETIEIDVTKKWNDSNNQDGKRPKTVTVRLYGDGIEVAAKEIKEADEWKCSFTDLPKHKDGKEIIYTVTEDAVADYTSSVGGDFTKGFEVTNCYTPGRVSIPVTKAWEDGNNQDGIRPEEITIKLYADGKATNQTLILNEENHWTGSFSDLEEYQAGEKVVYTVEEVAVKGYETEIRGDAGKGFTVSNSYTPETIEIDVTKKWEDSNNQDGKRPETVTVRLHGDGKEVAAKEIKKTDDWKCSFTELPKYKDGEEIIYTVTEDAVADYTSSVDGDSAKGFVVTNSYTPGKISIPVTKAWEDGNNQDGIRPKEITIKLYADDKATDKTLVLSEDNQWTGSFSDLAEYQAGEKVVYTIEEVAVEGYESKVSGDVKTGFTVTNSHMPEKTKVDVTKVWEDNNNQDGKRPETVKVRLYADGATTGKTLTLNEVNQWRGSFSDLDKYSNGKEIVYTMTEDTVTDYTGKITGDQTNGFTVTNSYTPGKTSINVTKKWEDNNNQDGIRPKEITIKLYADDKATDKTLILNEENHWTGSFSDLAEYQAGEKVVYTIEEVAVEGYESKVSGDAKTGFTVTNNHTPKVPETPEEPDKPNPPETPEEPDKPNPPETPGKPEKPNPPETSDKSNLSDSEDEAVKTGDDTRIGFSLLALVASAVVITTSVVWRKRKKN